MFFNSVPPLKRVWIQEESLQVGFYTLGASIGGLFMVLVVVRGVWAPFINAIPSFPFNCFLSSSLHKWAIMNKLFGTATMVTALLFCLGIFHCPCQFDQKLLCHPLNSTRVITLWILTIISILFF